MGLYLTSADNIIRARGMLLCFTCFFLKNCELSFKLKHIDVGNSILVIIFSKHSRCYKIHLNSH